MNLNLPTDPELLLEDPLVVSLWRTYWTPYLENGGDRDALPPEDVDRFWRSVFPEMIADSDAIVALLREGWTVEAEKAQKARAAETIGLTARLEHTWGEGFRLLDEFVWLTEQLLRLNQWRARRGADPENPNWSSRAQLVLLARAIQTAHEVRTLLRAGFAAGAWGRWRTLHEISVVAKFIAEHGDTVAERYMLHDELQHLRVVQAYSKHSPTWRSQPGAVDGERELKARSKELHGRFGEQFGTDFGWALPALGNEKFGRTGPPFGSLEEAVRLSHAHPAYVKANHAIHASVRGFTDNPGHAVWPPRELLCGPSEYGLDQPAGWTLQSLTTTASASIGSSPLPSQVFHVGALAQARDEASDAFLAALERIRAERASGPGNGAGDIDE